MIAFSLRVVVAPQQRAELLRLLAMLLGPTRVEPGCLGCHCYADVECADAVLLVEHWHSQAMLEGHLGTDAFRMLLTAIDLSVVEPEVHFDTIAQRAGLEWFTRLRSRPSAVPDTSRTGSARTDPSPPGVRS